MEPVRQATDADIPELVRLRELLGERMGAGTAGGWQEAYAEVLRERMGGPDLVAYVVDAPGAGLAACGIGIVQVRLPGPFRPDGRVGHLLNMVTDPAWRRRGYGSAILTALLRWFRERDVNRVDLHATPEGAALYRRHGFREPPNPALTWHPTP
ncbi:GNAT family N-acetyltransferase [Bailinhaonella thermotolerans]|uniref:GNAT family N-acetyltransferase n=1 Tax=Bailinhaonella thermotolerans TaxID=1070861 RepID=A0A3A4AZ20_9ACTN|nr:GNAT family N-acetyltransferase [Bailinhaonella thermotolerans]RJL33629.1 GNAT family N-acetyltransferase [Bailinhaonella thermotolerans]